MRRVRWFAGLAVLACGLAAVASAGANKPAPVPGEKAPPPVSAPVSGAAAPMGYIEVDSSHITLPAGGQLHGTVSCPAGTVVWGGGVFVNSAEVTAGVNGSYPLGNTRGWQGDVFNLSSSETYFYVSAICAKQPAGYKIVKKSFANPALLQSGGLAACPATATVIGGGGSSSSPATSISINSSYPYNVIGKSGWVTEMNNASGDSHPTMATYAVCARKPAPGGLLFDYPSSSPESNPAGQQVGESANCPGSGVVISGGMQSSSNELNVNINATYPGAPTVWTTYQNNGSSLDQTFKVYAVCVS